MDCGRSTVQCRWSLQSHHSQTLEPPIAVNRRRGVRDLVASNRGSSRRGGHEPSKSRQRGWVSKMNLGCFLRRNLCYILLPFKTTDLGYPMGGGWMLEKHDIAERGRLLSTFQKVAKHDLFSIAQKIAVDSDSPTVAKRALRNKWIMAYSLSKFDSQERTQNRIEEPLLQRPNSDNEFMDSECRVAETPMHMEMETKNSMSAELKDDLRDAELSPRLAIFVEKGAVPESPIVENRRSSSTMEHRVLKDPNIENDHTGLLTDCCIRSMDAKKSIKDMADPAGIQQKESPIPEYVLPDIPRLSTSPTSKNIISENEMVNILYHADEVNIDIGKMSGSLIKEIQTPLVNKQDHSSSEDWQLSSGEASKSIQQPCKFKRLCKYVDIGKRSSSQTS